MATNAAFAGNSLQTFDGVHGIILQEIHHAGKTNRQAQTYAFSHANRSSIPFVEWPNKPITLTGEIVGSSIADCDAQIDNFNSLLLTQNGNLDFDYNGASLSRRYVGTFTNVDVMRPNGLSWANFTAVFTATQPFGQDTSTTTVLSASGRTSNSYQDSLTFAGTAPFQLPTITVTFSAIGSAPVVGTVSLGNDSTGQQINVTRTWAATDVLVVDCTLNTNTPVTVNGVAVDFTGAFPDFSNTTGTLDYLDTFSSRTFAILVLYYKNYL